MALTLFGPLVADVRGKVGNVYAASTHNRARWGTYTRPRNPSSPSQTAIRATLKTLAQRWGTVLNQTPQRDGWISRALVTNWTDIFGQTYHLTGLALYILVNQNLATIGEAVLDDAPGSLTCGSPGTATIAFNGGAHLYLDTGTHPAANEHAVIWAAPPCSPGVAYVGKKYRIMAHFAAAVAGPWDIITPYQNKYGILTSGRQVCALVNFIDDRYGWQGTPATASGIIP